MVGRRCAGRDSQLESAGFSLVSTFGLANWGMYRSIGSSSPNRPSSQSIITAREVIALDCDAIRKMSSRRSGARVSVFRYPYAL